MDLTVIGRIAKARWLILLLAGLAAVYATGRLGEYQDQNRLTDEAITVINFTEDPATLDRANFEEFLEDQYLLARDVNSDVVGSTPGPFIPWQVAEVDLKLDQNQLSFIGRANTPEEASELVDTMRTRYLAISSVGAGYERLTVELTDLAAEIASLEANIAAQETPDPLTEEQIPVETRRSILVSTLVALTQEYARLQVELVNPIERSADAIRNDIERVQSDMLLFQAELATLPPDPEESPAVDEQLILDQLTLDNLRLRYATVYAQRASLEGLASDGPIMAQAVTATTSSPFTNQALAFAAAVVLALFALVGIERARGIVWAKKEIDVQVPALTELPPRGFNTFKRPTHQPWYLSVLGGRRKASIQLIRSQLDSYRNAAVAFQGIGVFAEDTLELAADVALSAAVSGRSVLLIDATFSDRNDLVEYGRRDGPDLSSLLAQGSADPEAVMAEMKSALLGQHPDQSNLHVVRSHSDEIDAGDAMASQRFDMLLDVARANFDLVILAGAGFGEPTSYILAQRVDNAILVGSIGHTVDRDIEAVERDYMARRANLLGIVLLRKRRSHLRRWVAPRIRRSVWRFTDNLEPMTVRVKDSFGRNGAEDEKPGIGGFTERLGEVDSVERERYLSEAEDTAS